MNEPERTPWMELFDEYQRVVVGAGALLRDADRLMAQRGYRTAHAQNTAGTESSFHMEQPERWTPSWFARFYRSDARPAVVPYVAVFLHDRRGAEDYDLKKEPLVVAGVILSATEQICPWYYWQCKWWFWTEGHQPDGPPVKQAFEPGSKEGQASNESFAIRLERVQGLADLEQLVVEPLLRLAG